MITFEALQERSSRHYRAVHIENREGLKDPSCVICYPPEGISEKFDKFWNWYETKVPAATYSEYTLRIFKDLLGLEIGTKNRTRDTKLINLIGSIKYSEKPGLSVADIAIQIIEIFVCSKSFELSIEQAEENLERIQQGTPENSSEEEESKTPESSEHTETEQEELFDTGIEYEVERALENLESINTELEDNFEENSNSEKSEETTGLTNTEELEIISETESETSEYNLNLLFEENLVNMAGITRDEMLGVLQGVFGEHGENMRPIMKVREFYGRDNEDPHEWCAEFEKACAANGWAGNANNVRRRDIAASYLRENAAEWYEEDQANIAQWHTDGQNDNFRERFKSYFSPQSKQIQWQVELTNIKQEMGESIEDYAKRFRKILRKVNYTNALADGVRVNYFIKGLNPMYITQVMSANPANLNDAVKQAKLLETGTQIAGLSITGNITQSTQNKEREDTQKNQNTSNWNKDNLRGRDTFGNTRRNNFGNDYRNNGRDTFGNTRRNNFGNDNRNNRDNDTSVDELTRQLEKMKIQMANLTKNNGRNNYDDSWRRGVTCYRCNKRGHLANECHRNQGTNVPMENRRRENGNNGRQEYERNSIQRLNYVYEDEEDYDNYFDDCEDLYVTTRSGLNTQGKPRGRPKREFDGTHRKTVGKAPMKVDEDEEMKVRKYRGKSIIDKVEDYDIVEDLMQQQVQATFAQMLKDPKQQKLLRDAIKRKTQQELVDEQ